MRACKRVVVCEFTKIASKCTKYYLLKNGAKRVVNKKNKKMVSFLPSLTLLLLHCKNAALEKTLINNKMVITLFLKKSKDIFKISKLFIKVSFTIINKATRSFSYL